MSDDPQILSRRLAAFVKTQGSAKQLARIAGCDERTAENMRRGESWPSAKHWLGLWLAFGDDLLKAVFHPEQAAMRLEREVADLERKLAERKAELEQVGGVSRSFAPRHPQAPASHEDGAAVTTP